MAPLGQTKVGLAAVILTVFLGLNSVGEGFKQELRLSKDDDTGLRFNTHVPDLAEFSSTLPEITKCCMIGVWETFITVNYVDPNSWAGNSNGSVYCHTCSATTLKSLRYLGANDSSTNAISLYTGRFYDGEEIFLTVKAKTDISITIGSLAVTGTSDWMLYEGKMLDGKEVCYKIPTGDGINYNGVKDPAVNLTTIGSVFRGCDAREIKLYKDSHLM